ncbi:MAG: magnesium transporter CorA family protein [Bryobacteraceae bacterium]
MNWVDVAPGDTALEEFGQAHGFHPLHLEDCRSDEQQAKIEPAKGYLFIVLKLILLRSNDELSVADLDLFLGSDYLVTVHRAPVPLLPQSIANTADLPADEAFYRILDAVVDSYLPVLDAVEDRVDSLEDLVIRRPDQKLLEHIADLLTTLLELRRVLANTRRIAFTLQRMHTLLIRSELQPFIRDVHDHLERDLGSAASERERLKGLLDIHHSSLASRNNEATRILTVMGTVSLPAVVIASFFGMSLKYPGWMSAPWAILIVIGLIVAVTSGLLWYLKKRDYL